MSSLIQYAIIGGLGIIAITQFPTLTVAIIGVIILLWLIRLGADIFWNGRDKGRW